MKCPKLKLEKGSKSSENVMVYSILYNAPTNTFTNNAFYIKDLIFLQTIYNALMTSHSSTVLCNMRLGFNFLNSRLALHVHTLCILRIDQI